MWALHMGQLSEFLDGDMPEPVPKKSTAPLLNASPERHLEASFFDDSLSIDMAEARWDVLQTLLLEERQAREAQIAELRKELHSARSEIQAEVTDCSEEQKQIKLTLQGLKEAPTFLAVQEEFKSLSEQLQNEFALRIAQIQEQLEEKIHQSACLRRDVQPALAITRVASLKRPVVQLAVTSPRAETRRYSHSPQTHIRRSPSAKFNAVSTDSGNKAAAAVHRLTSGQYTNSVQASMLFTLQPPSAAAHTTVLSRIPSAWQCAGSDSTASSTQRTFTRTTTPMLARGNGVAASVHSQSQRLLSTNHMISKQETNRWASPLANARISVPPSADLSPQDIRLEAEWI